MKTVYLAGPITGLTHEASLAWRTRLARAFADAGVKALTPNRGRPHLKDQGILEEQYIGKHPLDTPQAICAQDRNDVRSSDVVLMNLLEAPRVSIGTMMEVAWADAFRVPLVVAMEREGNPHEHAMLRGMAAVIVHDLDDAWAASMVMLGFDVTIAAEPEKDWDEPRLEEADPSWEVLG
jgi:nucleoside 2-deoxyribosyltransferase